MPSEIALPKLPEREETVLRGRAKDNPYNKFHRTIEVQVFPQNLRVTWDDTGCFVSMLLLLIGAVVGLGVAAHHLRLIKANEEAVNDSDTIALFSEANLLIVILFCLSIILGFFVLCACGVNTQLMAARKRRFGSLRKNRILLSLMRGQSAWDEPEFQRRLRLQERRLERIQDTVEARLESWLNQRDARVTFMHGVRAKLLYHHTNLEMKAGSHAGCAIL